MQNGPEEALDLQQLGHANNAGSEDIVDDETERPTSALKHSRRFLQLSPGYHTLADFGDPSRRLRSFTSRKRAFSLYLSVYLVLLLFGSLLFVFTVKDLDVSKDRVVLWLTQERPSSPLSQHSLYLNSTPTMLFRDNLVDGNLYVTAWPIEGFTNQFIAQVNLVYLALLARRIPVLPSFEPSQRHMPGKDAKHLPVSEVFDLSELSNQLGRPILEWKDLKNDSSHEVEDLGCWSVFKTIFGNGPHFETENNLALDVSLTQVPESVRLPPTRRFANIMVLASLGWSEARSEALQDSNPSPSLLHKVTIPPDETMLCYDNLYYVSAASDYEWEHAWSPSWNLIGRYMRYNPRIEALARGYVLRTFGLTIADSFPSYISVHVRHTDFKSGCYGRPLERCFAPLSVFAERVEEVKADLQTLHGIRVNKVLVTSDETNQTWWDGVRDLGWNRLDHEKEQTEKKYGPWYLILLDTITLSLAKGFVGTKGSTLSLVAAKRVQHWEDGPIRQVSIGFY